LEKEKIPVKRSTNQRGVKSGALQSQSLATNCKASPSGIVGAAVTVRLATTTTARETKIAPTTTISALFAAPVRESIEEFRTGVN
jgi:hypothetical protein